MRRLAVTHAYRNIYPTFAFAPVDLVAICDLDPERETKCARLFGAPRTYVDHHAMLARERPELVFIATNYDAQHLPIFPALAIDCLRTALRGKGIARTGRRRWKAPLVSLAICCEFPCDNR